MSIHLHFTAEDWQRTRQNWSAWWAGELDRPLVMIQGSDLPVEGSLHDAPNFVTNLPLDLPVDDVLDRYQTKLEATHFYGDAWPRWWPNFGPGIIAGFLGAQVHCVPDTVWFSPNASVPVSELKLDYDPQDIWWRRIQALTRRAVERWGNQVAVSHTDLGGNLDILASFRTSEGLLLELYDAPEEIARLAGDITRLWLRYYDELAAIICPAGSGTTPWAPIWSPGRCYMLQSDFSYMISPKMFERYVLPDLAACCEALDHGFYHLDGKGEIPHLDMLLSLERLRGIQWIPGDGAPAPECWLTLLKRIRDGGKLCQLFVKPQGALTIIRELGGKGFALWIDQPMEAEEASEFLKAIMTYY